jgi:hypothetical protein
LKDLSDWPLTTAEVDAFLDSMQDTADDGSLDEVAARVASRVMEAWRHPAAPVAQPGQGHLFSQDDGAQRGRGPRADLREVVLAAYRRCSGGDSIDLLLADPARNACFVQACWQLNAKASAAEFNWVLLNARKAGRLGRVPCVNRFRADETRLNRCGFAAEWALRFMQENAYFGEQRNLSLDLILCDPSLASRFEDLARRLAPGFESIDYRWAALRCRKNLNRFRQSDQNWEPTFEYLGRTASIRVHRIPSCPGLVWLRRGDRDVYFGSSTNLRDQVEQMMSVEGSKGWVIPEWLAGGPSQGTEIAVSAGDRVSATVREASRALFVIHEQPRHNIFTQSAGGLLACG